MSTRKENAGTRTSWTATRVIPHHAQLSLTILFPWINTLSFRVGADCPRTHDEAIPWLILFEHELSCPVFDIGFFDSHQSEQFVMAALDRLSGPWWPRETDVYYDNSAMTRHMQSAVQHSLAGGSGDFLERFKAYGWYLDDLVLTPVNNLTKSERRAKCLAAQKSLADRIVKYRPLAIVSLLLSIESVVNAAANTADSDAPRFAVPFPGVGQQMRFRTAMTLIIPKLPKLTEPS
jgi:hypothetical protein